MDNNLKKNLDFYRNIDYPEYSLKNRKKSDDIVDLALLDLALSQREYIDKRLISIISKLLVSSGKYMFSQDQGLIQLIAEKQNIPVDNVLITAGCDGALGIISRVLISEQVRVGIPLPSFGRYEYHAKVNKAKINFILPESFPYNLNLDIIYKEAQNKHIDLIFLANPNNPTGIYFSEKELINFLSKYKGVVILDEALCIFDYQTSIKLIKNFPQLIIARSFSKLYGLAGLRIGYVVADRKIISSLRKVVSPFETSSISITMAKTVLIDEEYVNRRKKDVRDSLNTLKNLNGARFKVTNSDSSVAFVEDTKKGSLYRLLLEKGIKTISSKNFRGMEKINGVRIALIDAKAIKKFVNVLNYI